MCAILFGHESGPKRVELYAKNHYRCEPFVYELDAHSGLLLPAQRHTWTGGDTPTKEQQREPFVRALRRKYFREYVKECGGLDLWKCAGTSSMERARIFWNRATADAWRTLNNGTAPAPKRFRVCTPRNRLFTTLVDAKAYAEAYFNRTGIIVAITERK